MVKLLLSGGSQKNTCKHEICVLSVGEIFREDSVKQSNNSIHKKTLNACVFLDTFPLLMSFYCVLFLTIMRKMSKN